MSQEFTPPPDFDSLHRLADLLANLH